MGYHEGARALTGGFLGVDVFFVLSGFLITDLLATQPRDLKNFWLRRARRLLPPLAVMLVIVTAAATIIEPDAGSSLRPALLAAVTYTSNWYQLLHHVSYFASFGPASPLEHLWSLAIEEQFYLLWPAILWFLIFRHNDRRAWIAATLLGAAASAVAMALLYTPSNPSLVYYGTDTHASALLIGAALALACPLATLAKTKAAMTRRLDAAGIAGLVVLAWAMGHFSGDDAVVYPVGLLMAAIAAAAVIASAASRGAVAAAASIAPLRWVGVRSYAMYLWHWPVIALTAVLAGRAATSPLIWAAETGLTIALAAASWRIVESPILTNGFLPTCRTCYRQLATATWRPASGLRRVLPMTVSLAAVGVIGVAGYGLLSPAGAAAQSGLLRQVAAGARISAASQLKTPQAGPTPTATPHQTATPRTTAGAVPSERLGAHRLVPLRGTKRNRLAVAKSARATACHADGWQVTAVGDSVMLASAAALEGQLPGIYIDARVGRQMETGVQVIQDLAVSGSLRHFVLVGLGTNGAITAGEIWQLREAVGPHRELILVNTFGPMSWEPEVNDVLADATWHKPNVEVVNWAQAIAPRSYLLWGDGIHPQPVGARLYARVVASTISGNCGD